MSTPQQPAQLSLTDSLQIKPKEQTPEKVVSSTPKADRSPRTPSKKPGTKTLAPMLQQYLDLKQGKFKDHILLFQVGDFYEVFFDDAKVAADVLSIRLTSRDKNSPDPIMMCGVPVHALDGYLPKLIAAGISCAIMSQVEGPAPKKGMVKRELTRIITPGIRYEGDGLDEKKRNYLASAFLTPQGQGALSYVDVSTGLLRVREVESEDELLDAVEVVQPSELILPSTLEGRRIEAKKGWLRTLRAMARQNGIAYVSRPFDSPSVSEIESRLKSSFEETAEFPVDEMAGLVHQSSRSALLAVIDYVDEMSAGDDKIFSSFKVDDQSKCVVIDAATQRNLELFETRVDGDRRNSLIGHIDQTKTSMGARLLREWLQTPSTDLREIESRHDAVDELISADLLEKVKSVLAEVRDLERLLSRVTTRRAHPRDLRMLADSTARLPELAEILAGTSSGFLQDIAGRFDPLEDLFTRLDRAIEIDPPTKLGEGGILKAGFDETVDELRERATNGKQFLAELEAREREATGISGLKVRYNNVFGYYIEVSKAHSAKVPERFDRKQTLVNAERFITPELKELEVSILSARVRQVERERELFVELRTWVAEQAGRIQRTAYLLSQIDVLSSFASLAKLRNYVRPEMVDGNLTKIEAGRHSVVEKLVGEHNFVANDALLDGQSRRFAILTGPNMGGKSTYLRQVGLVQLLAQAGSFVPARSASLGIVDRIFTRIGTGDDLTRGDSTFMVEMREATSIIRKATSRSLVLIDEVGRGTATSDGLAIATAIAEWLHDRVGCRTIFATHFHELTDLALHHAGAFCISVGIVENEAEREIFFTHRIEERKADRSYGVEVARIAGLPEQLLKRAQELLDEAGDMPVKTLPKEDLSTKSNEGNMVEVVPDHLRRLADAVSKVNPDAITPIDALQKLYELRLILNGGENDEIWQRNRQ